MYGRLISQVLSGDGKLVANDELATAHATITATTPNRGNSAEPNLVAERSKLKLLMRLRS
jgi:hypothetical protein